jgi:hypothetical protein
VNRADGDIGPLYIQLNGQWHRFYLDAGLLFWREGDEPDPEDDLLEGDDYSDLTKALAVNGCLIEEIRMHEGTLTVRFDNGALLELRSEPQDEGTIIVKLEPSLV